MIDKNDIGRTPYKQANPQWDDLFTRKQIVEYLDCIRLGEKSELELNVIIQFLERTKLHFMELDVNWKDNNIL